MERQSPLCTLPQRVALRPPPGLTRVCRLLPKLRSLLALAGPRWRSRQRRFPVPWCLAPSYGALTKTSALDQHQNASR